jgi:hypothetical protein
MSALGLSRVKTPPGRSIDALQLDEVFWAVRSLVWNISDSVTFTAFKKWLWLPKVLILAQDAHGIGDDHLGLS